MASQRISDLARRFGSCPLIGVTPRDILAHIRMIYATELENLQILNRAINLPLYGYVVGDEPPPPPRTNVEYYSN